MLALLLACADPTPLDMAYAQPTCADASAAGSTAESTAEDVALAWDGDTALIQHTNTTHACAATFAPDIDTDDEGVIHVREFWDGDEDDADCFACFDPQISIAAPPAGAYEVRWYLGDSATPLETVTFEVE